MIIIANLLVLQSGGPTAAINATVFGVFEKWQEHNKGDIYFSRYGIKGIFSDEVYSLKEKLIKIDGPTFMQTPSCALGSSRYKLKDFEEDEHEYENILKFFKKNKISYFICIGGNDSMDTALKISKYFKIKNIDDIFVVGAPKTIDNDLYGTDHCPGFGSAAKYIATTFCELERDISCYDVKSITLVETMGRDTGWLCASSCLSRLNGACGPDLIYCCENVFSIDRFLDDLNNKLKEKSNVLVALSEGIKNEDGVYISYKNEETDVFGHKQNSGSAKILENIIKKNIDCKVRSIELNISQRAASHIASKTDIVESKNVGKKAVEIALLGQTGEMSNIIRKKEDEYLVTYSSVGLENVANKVRYMPKDFLLESDVSEKAYYYLKPLILGEQDIIYKNGIPLYIDLFSNYDKSKIKDFIKIDNL